MYAEEAAAYEKREEGRGEGGTQGGGMRNRETEPGVPIFSLKPCALKPCHSSKGLHLMVSSPPRRTPGWSLRFNTGDFWDRFKTQTTVQCEDLYTVSI